MPPGKLIHFPTHRSTARARPPGAHGPAPHGTGGKVVDITDAQLKELSLDLLGFALDLAGIADPTPTSDAASAILSISRGQWLDAIISGVSMVPYVGDLAKAGKLPKYAKALERAIELAKKSEKVAHALTPAIRKLKQGLDLLPRGANFTLDRIKDLTEAFLRTRGAAKVAKVLPDISRRFLFYSRRIGNKEHKFAEGWLGVPGRVKKHRSLSSQRRISRHTGDDAGHLIGDRFGPPGGVENLSRQNWKANQGGGTFHDLENEWDALLQRGYKIRVKVEDVSHVGTGRPYHRKVEWSVFAPNGKPHSQRELSFMNAHTEKSRVAAGIKNEMPEGHLADVIPIDRARKP